ncbi:1591_t:CDS:2 [Dentiscutata erythropus]|uniref:1591_t:CDS:1 n=1 Tax=Dentiscutata erythropus TaxID=1348616 RepID=A0A9N9DT21_9GLOM|nr:1591_t:CDS:2 [Dentiscutata erythropus]
MNKKHNLRNRIVFSEISTNISINRNDIRNFFPTYNPTVAESLEKFFQTYNPRLVTQLDFYIWRVCNNLEVEFFGKDYTLFANGINRVRQQEKWTNEDIKASKENPRGFVKWCEQELATTLEKKKLHPNISDEIVGGDIHHRNVFKKYVFLQNNTSEWIITNNEGIDVDIGNSFAKTIKWNKIKTLNYDHPILSYIVDFTELQEELLELIGPKIYEKIACIPNRYTIDLPVNFRNLFQKLYCDQKRWQYDNFGKINDNDRKQPFYIFMRDVCKHIFSLWDEDIKETHCLEGTWSRLVLDSILNSITESSSLASAFRKVTYARKPDFWLLVESAGTIQEILFEETSGGPFVNDTDKFHTDRYKLFRFGHDSKIMMVTKLISENAKYLFDYNILQKRLCDINLFLIQAYSTKLRVFIMDQPGPPLCRVREVFDLKIPYKSVDEDSVLQFIHSLWMIRLGLEESVNELENIGREIQVKYQGPLKNFIVPVPNLEYLTFPSP